MIGCAIRDRRHVVTFAWIDSLVRSDRMSVPAFGDPEYIIQEQANVEEIVEGARAPHPRHWERSLRSLRRREIPSARYWSLFRLGGLAVPHDIWQVRQVVNRPKPIRHLDGYRRRRPRVREER
jgi:hypothetical protein